MNYEFIRSGTFLISGLVCIIFRKQLNNVKNRWLTKFNIKIWVGDERKAYVYIGIIYIIIAIVLFISAIII